MIAALCLAVAIAADLPMPPAQPWGIDSPFPAIHGGPYRQGHALVPGIHAGDQVQVTTAALPADRASPWLLWSEPYPDGSRVLWGATTTDVFKAISSPSACAVVATYAIDDDPRMQDSSWSFLLLPGKRVLANDGNTLFELTDADQADPRSGIVLLRRVVLPDPFATPLKFLHLYDGHIAVLSQDGVLGVLDQATYAVRAAWRLDLLRGEFPCHNDYAADQDGRIYFSTSRRMVAVRWDGAGLALDWQVPMDFGGNRLQGVGTTPTLIGSGPADDRLVCVVDSQTPARFLAFWRDAIPPQWRGLPGEDRRLAGILPLPGYAPRGLLYAAVENSPVAHGYDLACAQFNGFLGQPADARPGVTRVGWDPDTDRLVLRWHRDDIVINGVLMLSIPTGLLHGSGRTADGSYALHTLDWATGASIRRDRLGDGPRFDDPGCANVIGPHRELIFSSRRCLVRIQPE
jgi:hypothetical protein